MKRTAWYTKLMELSARAGDRTQQDIALRLGVSPAAVTYWKDGRLPAAQTVVTAAEVYDTDALDLLGATFLEGPRGQRPPV